MTNDMVEIKDEGKFFWKGRFDNLINSGGIKINPEIIEDTLADIYKIETIALGIPHEKLGQQLVLVSTRELTKTEADMIRGKWRQVLPLIPAPMKIVTCKSIPRNDVFKVDRIKLAGEIIKLMEPLK
jgi:O-succinylbenzoic acid--CoA ligase